MSDEAAFIRAICELPFDDGPRRVWCDDLDERGDPRGEYVRLGCDLADLPPGWPTVRASRLVAINRGESWDTTTMRRPEFQTHRPHERIESVILEFDESSVWPSNVNEKMGFDFEMGVDQAQRYADGVMKFLDCGITDLIVRNESIAHEWRFVFERSGFPATVVREPARAMTMTVWPGMIVDEHRVARDGLKSRMAELEKVHPELIRIGGLGVLDEVRMVPETRPAFMRRGMWEVLSCTEEQFFRWAPTIFRWNPIIEVDLIDKRPHREVVNDEQRWEWYRASPIMVGVPFDANYYLSENLFNELTTMTKTKHLVPTTPLTFKSESEARKLLSRACVNVGREMVKPKPLPPLEWPPLRDQP